MQRVDKSVALADFGIAKSMQITQENGLIQALQNDVIGTPHYLSSEQACGQTIIRQSDLYSLGTMMFEMLAGKHPFMAGSLGMLLAQHLNAQTPALSARTHTPAARRQLIDTRGFRPALRFSTTFAGTSESVAIKKCTAQAPCF